MQLLYECILCHQHKPITMLKSHGNFYSCISCSEHYQPTITVIPTQQTPIITLPTPTDFSLFYDDILFYKSDTISTLVNNTLTITNPKTAKFIQINPNSILQLLADKYDHPTICESTSSTIDFQLYMRNLYALVQEKTDICVLRFNKIMAFEDKRIRDLCESYANIISTPLHLKLQFQEWEKTLISAHITSEVEKQLHEKEQEIEKIRNDYSEKLEKEKIKHTNKFESYQREILRLQGLSDSLNRLMSSSKEELTTVKNEKDEMYERFRNLEAQIQEKDTENVRLKFESEKLKKELEKYKISEEWILDPTSTTEEPIYFNQISGQHVTFPINFKENYKPDSTENDNLIYKEKSGENIFKLPKSLLQFIKSPTTLTENGKSKPDSLKENDTKVLNSLSRDKENALTRKEICEATEINPSHIGDHLKKLKTLNLIISFKKEDEKEERFYRL